MSNYLVNKYKGKWRILPEIDQETNDFPKNENDTYDEDEVYITCNSNCRIYYYGKKPGVKAALLTAYIPSLGRGRNAKKFAKENNVELFDYDESDSEVVFKFQATDIEKIAEFMKPRISGANISPHSPRNLPKSDIKMPEEEINKYKNVIGNMDKDCMLEIKNANNEFLNEVLAKKLRQKNARKPFDYKTDMKKLMLSRDVKTYIWHKGLWQEYIEFIKNKLNK